MGINSTVDSLVPRQPDSLQLAFFCLPIFTATILSLPPSSLFRLALYPVPFLVVVRALLYPPTEARNTNDTYLLGLLGANFTFRFSDYLYIQGYNSRKHFYRSRIREDGSSERQDDPQSIFGGIKWALLLMLSPRGIGWNIQVPLPQTEYARNRIAFLKQCVMTLLQIYLALYFVGTICSFIVKTLRGEMPGNAAWIHSLCHNQIFLRVVILIGWISSIVAHLSALYNQVAIVCVGLGVGRSWSRTHSWPNSFWSPKNAWSIRNVWGKTWHQSIRRCLTAPGERIASLIFGEPSGLSRETRLVRRYFLLFSAFSCSGLLHAAGVYFVEATKPMRYPDSTPMSARPSWHATAYFFYAQAVAITIEDFVCWSLKLPTSGAIDVKSVRWVVGFSYTITWFMWSLPALWLHPQLAAFGMQRIGETSGSLWYIHILEATGEAAILLPFNPWPILIKQIMSFANLSPLF